ncbi:hypothetical protein HC761_01370 [bacterium]|nr:hypothetical protein [bacterium]
MTPAQVLAFIYSQRPQLWRLALVADTRGSVPRRVGALMAVNAERQQVGSIGGGQGEAEVLVALDRLALEIPPHANAESTPQEQGQECVIDLRGGESAAGVCGGTMWVQLSRASPMQIQAAAQKLSLGHAVKARDLGFRCEVHIAPPLQLLIIGAGHCGSALAQMAQGLGYAVLAF